MSTPLHFRLSRRSGIGLAAAAVALVTGQRHGIAGPALAQSPEAFSELPSGALGEQIRWLLEVLNGDSADITEEVVTEHFSESFLQEVPAAEVVEALSEVAAASSGEVEVSGIVMTTMDEPPTVANFDIGDADGNRWRVSVVIDRDSGLIGSFSIEPSASDSATPAASPVAESPFPTGPLGEHAQWFVEMLNAGEGTLTEEELEAHFSPAYFETTPPEEALDALSELQASDVTWEVDPMSVIATMDLPTSVTRFTLHGSDGSQMDVGMTLDRETELIATLEYGPAGSLG